MVEWHVLLMDTIWNLTKASVWHKDQMKQSGVCGHRLSPNLADCLVLILKHRWPFLCWQYSVFDVSEKTRILRTKNLFIPKETMAWILDNSLTVDHPGRPRSNRHTKNNVKYTKLLVTARLKQHQRGRAYLIPIAVPLSGEHQTYWAALYLQLHLWRVTSQAKHNTALHAHSPPKNYTCAVLW